jgi:isopenicillin N synthase-like dioxygenase
MATAATDAAVVTIDIKSFRLAPHGQPLPPAARCVVAQWRRSFAGAGVAHVTGHGVPDAVIGAACGAARQFFCGSTPAEKRAVAKDAARDGGNRGYRPAGLGSASLSWSQADGTPLAARAEPPRAPDLVEQFELLSAPARGG